MALSPVTPNLFSPYSSNNKFKFKPIAFDTSILLGPTNSTQTQQLANAITNSVPNKLPSARDPSIIAPWEVNPEPGSLSNRMNSIRNMKKILDLDPRLSGIELAKGDRTSQNLFALYKALDTLKTIAQYSAEKNTLASSLPRLDKQFQQGLQEIKDFLPTASFEKLSIFFGKKQSNVRAPIGLGRDITSYEGQIVQTGASNDPLAGIVGNEQFNIRLVKSGTTTVDVNVDLAGIAGTVSINSVVDHINASIAAQAPTFQTSFEVIKDSNYDFGIGIIGSSLETVQFTPVASDPALYVVSDFLGANANTEVGTLTKLNGAESIDPTRATPTTVAGINTSATEIAEQIVALEPEPTVGTKKEAEPVNAETTTSGIATDSQGFVYVLGQTTGDFDGQYNSATGTDVFLNKFNSLGELVDTKLVGSGGSASAYTIEVDANDNVIIAGQTNSHLLSTDAVSGLDSFVTKYDSLGKEIFTYQLDTIATDAPTTIAIDAAGDIYLGGETSGAINSTSGFGGIRDGMIIKLDGTTGAVQSTQLLGGAGNEKIKSIGIKGSGEVIVTLIEDGNAIVRSLDPTNLAVENYNVSLGNIGSGNITDTYIDNDQLYVVGYTDNAALDAGGGATIVNAHAGGTDGFVFNTQLKVNNTKENYVTYFGGTGTDKINDVTFANGNLYVAGGTSDSVNGATSFGLNDSFAASLNATTGAVNYVEQFGNSLGTSSATGVAFVANGSSVLDHLGLPSGLVAPKETRDLVTQTSLRDGDSFFISVNGGAKRRVTIDAKRTGYTTGDTVDSLVQKINRISTAYIKSETVTGDNGDTIKIAAQRGATIELFSGDKGRDALTKMGLEPGKLMSSEILANIDPDPLKIDENDLGGVFGLRLSSGLNVLDKTTAKYSLGILEASITTLQRAYRSLVIDPVKLQLLQDAKTKNAQGEAPAYLTARIANFQDALNRLQGSTQQPGSSLFT